MRIKKLYFTIIIKWNNTIFYAFRFVVCRYYGSQKFLEC